MDITVKKLCKSFGNHSVLDNLDLKVNSGETVVILGGSGSGKTVLLRHIIGLIKPDAGEIIIGDNHYITGRSERELNELRRSYFGMVFQSSALINSLTVNENVGLGLKEQYRFTATEIENIIEEKLRLVELERVGDLYPEELSGGMKKRVAVARALAMEPDIILYDEPTAGLDPIISRDIFKIIRELEDQFQRTSLVVTHDMQGALSIADKIGLLADGKIVEFNTPHSFQESKHELVQKFLCLSNHGNNRRSQH